MCARLVGFRLPSPQDTSQLPSQARHMGGPQHARTHVQQGTHVLISGSPRCKRLGGGGFERSESGLLPKSIGILSPPPPGPHLRLWRSQQQVRIPPPTHSHWAASFSTASARGWSWGTAPPASLLAPLLLVLSFSCPLLRERGAYVWVGSFPLSMGACSRSGWGWVAQEEIRLES